MGLYRWLNVNACQLDKLLRLGTNIEMLTIDKRIQLWPRFKHEKENVFIHFFSFSKFSLFVTFKNPLQLIL
jgi:hypothetical protein